MPSKKQLLTWVEACNKGGRGYHEESEAEMEMLQLMAEAGEVVYIGAHNGYRLPSYNIRPKPEPLTPEQIAGQLSSERSRANIPFPDSWEELEKMLEAAAVLARKNFIRLN